MTVRETGTPTFNGSALPVCSVASREEGEQLIVLTCAANRTPHPKLPGQTWYRLNSGPYSSFSVATIEPEDLGGVSEYLAGIRSHIRSRQGA